MTNVKMLVAKVAISMVAVGSLTTVGVGVSAAATSGPSPTHTHRVTGGERRLACTREARRLAFSTHRQAQFAAQTTVFAGLEANAKKADHVDLEAYWAKVVQHREAYSGRQHGHLVARSLRDAKHHGLVNGKCS
jgi:hypothetical protein